MKNTLIVILVVAVAVLAYLQFKPKETAAPVIPNGQTTTLNNQNGQDYQPNPSTVPPLPTHVGVQAGTWPPTIQHSTNAYSCSVGTINEVRKITEKTINGRKYCIDNSNEGAAGSTFASYTYTTPAAKGNGTETTTFTLRYISCAAYDEPENSQCEKERSNFNVDTIVDSLISR